MSNVIRLLMRLAIDGKRLIQARTGPARWLEHMLRHWAGSELPFEETRCYMPAPTECAWTTSARLRQVVVPSSMPMIYWENVTLRRAIAEDDVLFGASYSLPVGLTKRSVVSIQGIYEGPNAEPGPWWHRYRYSWVYKRSAEQADVVLANSVSTKNDLVDFYGIEPSKIRIVYQGVGAPFGWVADRDAARQHAQSILGTASRYFLFVGKLSVRRHVSELLAAFAEARRRIDGNMLLVLVGPNHVGFPLAQRLVETGLNDSVIYLPHVDQPELAALYSAATAFFLPTTHEGLSATILEAMACGTPVVTVDHAPLHEGFAENALVLEAADVSLLADAMVRVATDAALASDLSLRGRALARRFTWEDTARRTMDVLYEVACR